MNKTFKEEDKKKVVEFLNHVARHGKFTHNVQELIEFYKLLNFMQTEILPKIDANILEITKVVEPKE